MNEIEKAKLLKASVKLAQKQIEKTLQERKQDSIVGPIGPKGDLGPQGLKGDKGDRGEIGPMGFQGDKGDPGPQGLKGDKGDKGDTGPQGLKGDKGDKGDTGPQGLKGDKGDKGDTGPQGLKGDKGDTGPKGDTGLQGPKGDTGLQGPKGDKGDAGAQGPKGDKGDTGLQGPKGDKGDTGPQGIPGVSAPDLSSDFNQLLDKVNDENLKNEESFKNLLSEFDSLKAEISSQLENTSLSAEEYTRFKNDILQQIQSFKTQVSSKVGQWASSAGGGSVNILQMDDVEFANRHDVAADSVLIFDQATRKFKAEIITDALDRLGYSPGSGGGSFVETDAQINTFNLSGTSATIDFIINNINTIINHYVLNPQGKIVEVSETISDNKITIESNIDMDGHVLYLISQTST